LARIVRPGTLVPSPTEYKTVVFRREGGVEMVPYDRAYPVTQPAKHGRSRWLRLAAAVLVLLVVVAAGAFAMWGRPDGPVFGGGTPAPEEAAGYGNAAGAPARSSYKLFQHMGKLTAQRPNATSANTAAYNPTQHRWWRIRENAGTLYWEVSADGVGYTTFGQSNNVTGLDSVALRVLAYGDAAAPSAAKLDNVNR
jgi:hypothetical protein